MSSAGESHQPVLLEAALTGLNIQRDGTYVDCTFGRGGHSRAILDRLGPDGRVVALDRDPAAALAGEQLHALDSRFSIARGSFAMLRQEMERQSLTGKVNGILFDLGVSSPQLDDAARGFSFRKDGPLDMRMDPESDLSAAEWLAQVSRKELETVLRTYGEERYYRRIAGAIIDTRDASPLTTTRQLSELIENAAPTRERDKHPATRCFQAIRIAVNHELEILAEVLDQVIDVLAVGGRLVVISFHSLEDRIVKRFMRDAARGDNFPKEIPVTASQLSPRLRLVSKPIRPDAREIDVNPRSRSAIMRVAARLPA